VNGHGATSRALGAFGTDYEMATEIERKFLVRGESWRGTESRMLRQGYLNRSQEHTVRVRTDGDRAFLTIKGLTSGATRPEFEYAIPIDDANEMLDTLCEKPLIEKRRHLVMHAGKRWEVDEFLGDNIGLVVAELELRREDEAFALPEWVGKEVTHDPRYLNANLVQNPYRLWRDHL
jgi:CYTH domain-containing protein